MYTVQQVEDQVITVLKADQDLAAACPTIQAYGGQLDALLRDAPRITVMTPAVLVLYSGSRFAEVANRSYDEDMTFSAVVITRNLRGLADLRTGAYDLLQKIRSILIDSDLGMDIEPLHPVSVEALLIMEEMAVYAFDFKTGQSLD